MAPFAQGDTVKTKKKSRHIGVIAKAAANAKRHTWDVKFEDGTEEVFTSQQLLRVDNQSNGLWILTTDRLKQQRISRSILLKQTQHHMSGKSFQTQCQMNLSRNTIKLVLLDTTSTSI